MVLGNKRWSMNDCWVWIVAERAVTMPLLKSRHEKGLPVHQVACHQVCIRTKCPIQVWKVKGTLYIYVVCWIQSKGSFFYFILSDKIAFPFHQVAFLKDVAFFYHWSFITSELAVLLMASLLWEAGPYIFFPAWLCAFLRSFFTTRFKHI